MLYIEVMLSCILIGIVDGQVDDTVVEGTPTHEIEKQFSELEI